MSHHNMDRGPDIGDLMAATVAVLCIVALAMLIWAIAGVAFKWWFQ